MVGCGLAPSALLAMASQLPFTTLAVDNHFNCRDFATTRVAPTISKRDGASSDLI